MGIKSVLIIAVICVSGGAALGQTAPGGHATASIPPLAAPVKSTPAAHAVPLRFAFPTQKITATIESGGVTLEGQWSNFEERRQFLDSLAKVVGITAIFDHAVIKRPSQSDEEIRKGVEAAIQGDAGLSDASIKVAVNQGAVTLTGSTFDWLEKDIATWVAGKVPGVVDVIDHLQTEFLRRPDAEIVRSINEQLSVDVPGENSANIQVNVSAGVVILSGTTPTLKSRQDAVHIAAAAAGVKDVSNEIIVQPPSRSETQIAMQIRDQLGGRPSTLSLSDTKNMADVSRLK